MVRWSIPLKFFIVIFFIPSIVGLNLYYMQMQKYEDFLKWQKILAEA